MKEEPFRSLFIKYNPTDDIISKANHDILEEVLDELFGDETPEDRWREFLS